MTYCLAAIDLDGTLLHNEARQISPRNKDGVQRALAQGVTIILATGRRHETAAAFAQELRLAPQTPVISYNGAVVRTLAGETLWNCPLPAEPADLIVQFCAKNNYHLNYYLDDQLYVREETKWSRLYQARTGSVPRIMHDLAQFSGSQPTKLLLIDTPEITDTLCLHFQELFGTSVYVTKTEDEYLEFMEASVNKGTALALVCESLGIGRDQCIAFGDSYNDIPMLTWAGAGVAMGSGRPEAIAAADFVAPAADDDGVAVLLDQLLAQR